MQMENLFSKFKKILAGLFSSYIFALPKNNKKNIPMEFGIGGTQGDVEVGSESVTELSKNRTMFIQQLTDEAPYSPDLVYDLTDMDKAFSYFKPSKEINFTSEDGNSVSEVLEFNNVGNFGPKGITQQSVYLNDLKQKEEQLRAISKELKSNKALQNIVSNPETKQAFIDSIKSLLTDLESA
jgi:hypothetical protein